MAHNEKVRRIVTLPPADDVARVFGWLQSCVSSRAEAEARTIDVFARLHGPQSGWLHRAPAPTRQRYFAVRSVLELRGVH